MMHIIDFAFLIDIEAQLYTFSILFCNVSSFLVVFHSKISSFIGKHCL